MIRRQPIRRKAPLRRHTWLRARSRLRGHNKRRRARLFEQQFGGAARLGFIQSLDCATCREAPPGTQASHVRSRGAGGGPDDVIPQCGRCHRELHQLGVVTFEKTHDVELGALAARYARRWIQESATRGAEP